MTNWLDEVVDASPLRAKVGWKGELEFAGATEDDRSGRTVKFRIVRRPEEHDRAHPFSAFTRRRGKTAGSIFSAAVTSIASSQVVYSGEVMLLNWSDGPAGATVTLLVDEEADSHPFLGYSRASKQVAGSRFMAVLLEKQDDETIVDQEKRERAERSLQTGREQHLSNVAALMVKNPRFHDFLRETVEAVDWNDKRADVWLKDVLAIQSKSELDDDVNKRSHIAAFHRIRQRFVDWQEEQGLTTDPRRL